MAVASAFFAVAILQAVIAQEAGSPAAAQDLNALVGPIALYPDDLLSIVLPASTFPLQIVEADRWLAENKGNPEAKPDESWDDSVQALLNYPEVVSMMSNDLQWTAAMGEAVAADQTALMDSVQIFRRKAEGAGNLKSDDKQTVVVEEEVVKIVQADPQVIYVPQYEPQVVIIEQQVPVYPTYYPTPYPVYYYPYPPGYSFAAGVFWGASVAYAFDWHGGGIYNDIDIDIDRDFDRNVDRDRNTNIDNRPTNVDRAQSNQMSQDKRSGWQSKQNPADIRQGRGSMPSASTGLPAQRPQAGAGGAATTPRASTGGGANRSQPARSAGTSQANNRSAGGAAQSRDAFSGMSNHRSTTANSMRGASSRGGMGGGGRRR